MTKEQREALAFCLNAIDYVDIRYEPTLGEAEGFTKTQLRTGKQAEMTDEEVIARTKVMICLDEARFKQLESEIKEGRRRITEAEEFLRSLTVAPPT